MTAQPPPSRRTTKAPSPVGPLRGDLSDLSAGSDLPQPPPALRRDAALNRDKILAAARTAFAEEGVEVGVEVIAQRAGVGVGTLYRRFPTKEQLIDAVVDELLEEVLHSATRALEHESAGEGFAEFLRAVGSLQFEHAGCLSRLWRSSDNRWRRQIEVTAQRLLTRAQRAGTVRSELVYEDVIVMFWSLRGVIEATSSISPDAWLRFLELLLASLAPGAPLQHPPLTPEQAEQVKVSLREALQHRS